MYSIQWARGDALRRRSPLLYGSFGLMLWDGTDFLPARFSGKEELFENARLCDVQNISHRSKLCNRPRLDVQQMCCPISFCRTSTKSMSCVKVCEHAFASVHVRVGGCAYVCVCKYSAQLFSVPFSQCVCLQLSFGNSCSWQTERMHGRNHVLVVLDVVWALLGLGKIDCLEAAGAFIAAAVLVCRRRCWQRAAHARHVVEPSLQPGLGRWGIAGLLWGCVTALLQGCLGCCIACGHIADLLRLRVRVSHWVGRLRGIDTYIYLAIVVIVVIVVVLHKQPRKVSKREDEIMKVSSRQPGLR